MYLTEPRFEPKEASSRGQTLNHCPILPLLNMDVYIERKVWKNSQQPDKSGKFRGKELNRTHGQKG